MFYEHSKSNGGGVGGRWMQVVHNHRSSPNPCTYTSTRGVGLCVCAVPGGTQPSHPLFFLTTATIYTIIAPLTTSRPRPGRGVRSTEKIYPPPAQNPPVPATGVSPRRDAGGGGDSARRGRGRAHVTGGGGGGGGPGEG